MSQADSPSSSFWRRLFGRSAPSLDDPEELQRSRVALYLKFQLILLGSFFVIDVLGALIDHGVSGLREPGLAIHLVLVLALFAGWLFVRRGSHSGPTLAVVDITCLLLVAAAAAAMLRVHAGTEPIAGPAFGVAFAIVARAAIVPSSGKRTLLAGVAAAAIVTAGYAQRGWRTVQPPPDFVLIWTLAFSFASAAVSRSIYGLQKQVQLAKQLGQYVLEDKLGEGGMGIVYRARHAMLRRDTAVKLLLPERAGSENLARFEREVRQTARLTHPNTVTIFDYGRTPDGTFYYAMELLDGADLDEIVAVGGPLVPERVVHVLSLVAGALAEAHEAGLIHRDIKPANIVLCRQGGVADVPKVVDFGLVKQLDGAGDLAQTKADSILGTPLYLSPEAITSAADVDAKSDLYALGAVGYYLLTGQQVFEGTTVVEICVKHLEATPVPPSKRVSSKIPPALERLILDCLAKDPGARPQSALELQERLQNTGTAEWTPREARAWWLAHEAALLARREKAVEVNGSARTLAVDHGYRS
jgi:tRNA A-37 threonylcarbamoyl transferase component Bud32